MNGRITLSENFYNMLYNKHMIMHQDGNRKAQSFSLNSITGNRVATIKIPNFMPFKKFCEDFWFKLFILILSYKKRKSLKVKEW